MNAINSFQSGLLTSLLAFGSVGAAPAMASASDCTPRVLASPTSFPQRAQARGHDGTVIIDVTIDASGHAMDARLRRSSGHRLLDRAATASVMNGWVFDVSTCERKDLPADHVIGVEYRSAEQGD